MNYSEKLLGLQVNAHLKLRNGSLQQNISSAPLHTCYGYICVTVWSPGDSCFTGPSWRHEYTSILYMEACCKEIRNLKKNPSSFAGTPSFYSQEEELCICFCWAESRLKLAYIVPAAERPSGFGLPLYSSSLPLWLRSTFHGTDNALWQLCFLPPKWGHKTGQCRSPRDVRPFLCVVSAETMCQEWRHASDALGLREHRVAGRVKLAWQWRGMKLNSECRRVCVHMKLDTARAYFVRPWHLKLLSTKYSVTEIWSPLT